MKEKVLPTLVLTVICVAAALLLVLAHEMTADSIAEQKEKKFSSSVEKLFGKTDITLLDTTFGADDIEDAFHVLDFGFVFANARHDLTDVEGVHVAKTNLRAVIAFL